MHVPATVLFRAKWAPYHNLLQRRPHSERTLIFHTCRKGSSKRKNNLYHAVLLSKAGAMATYLSIADAQGPRPRRVRNITGILPRVRGESNRRLDEALLHYGS